MPEEKELIEKAKAGDIYSFEKLIEGCKQKAYNLAFHYMQNEYDAEDALQESFIKVFRYLKNFKGDSAFNTWVYRIVTNTCYDMLKKDKKNKNVSSLNVYNEDDELVEREIPDFENTPEKQLLKKEKIHIIAKALSKISEDHRMVIVLRDIQGFSYEEIAKILECSEGTVKSRINRARAKLQEIITIEMEL